MGRAVAEGQGIGTCPARRGSLREFKEEYKEYTLNMLVTPSGPFDGKAVEESKLMGLDGVFLAEVRPLSPGSHDPVLAKRGCLSVV
jgi:hypothetical protein